ncbi:MAG: hypothetical protein ACREVY_15900 [Gammaproteobacteria bacterium]
MSLKGSVWVDHGSHGDRHERDATLLAGELKAFLNGTAGVEFRPFEGDDARYAHIKMVLGRLAGKAYRIRP